MLLGVLRGIHTKPTRYTVESAKCLLVLVNMKSKLMKTKTLTAIQRTPRQPAPNPTPILPCPSSAWELGSRFSPSAQLFLSFILGVGNPLGKQAAQRERRTGLYLSIKEMDRRSRTQRSILHRGHTTKGTGEPFSCQVPAQVAEKKMIQGAEEMVLTVKYLPCKYKDLNSIPRTH